MACLALGIGLWAGAAHAQDSIPIQAPPPPVDAPDPTPPALRAGLPPSLGLPQPTAGDLFELLDVSFTRTGAEAIFIDGARSLVASIALLLIPVVAITLLAASWLLGVPAGPRRRRMWWKVGVVSLLGAGLGLATWWIPESWLIDRLSVPHEGNTGRTLSQLFALFHREVLRTAMFEVARALHGDAMLPPVFGFARLTLSLLAASLPVMVAAGTALGGGVLLSSAAAVALLLSHGVFQYVFSDHPIGAVTLFTALGVLALERVWSSDGRDRFGRLAAVAMIVFQAILADLRPETLALWLPADAAVAAAWIRRRPVGSEVSRIAASLGGHVRAWFVHPVSLVVPVLVVFLIVVIPAVLVRLPFTLFDRPRVALYFPLLMSTAAWGGFAPGLVRMASWLSPAAIVLVGAGMIFSIGMPLRAKGIGLGLVSLVSAHWFQLLSHPDFAYMRLVVSLVPIAILLGVQAIGVLGPLWRVSALAFVVSLTVVLAALGEPAGGDAWVRPLVEPPISRVDNSAEARYVGELLRQEKDLCLVAPVLAGDHVGHPVVPAELRRLDLMVLRYDMAARVPLEIPDGDSRALSRWLWTPRLSCGRMAVYLGLDCALEGLGFCDRVRERFKSLGSAPVGGPIFTDPVQYGRRSGGRHLEIGAIQEETP